MGGASGAKCGADRLDDAIGVLQHVVVPEAQNTEPFVLKPKRALCIFLRALRMLAAIDFDDEPPLNAHEVGDVAPERRLASEAMAVQLSEPEMAP